VLTLGDGRERAVAALRDPIVRHDVRALPLEVRRGSLRELVDPRAELPRLPDRGAGLRRLLPQVANVVTVVTPC
jgi:hypothetical protein